MIVYSSQIIKFINEIKSFAKHCLQSEIGLKVHGDRFTITYLNASFPIHIVIFNNNDTLGYFNPSFYELGFHECLMFTNKEQLHNIIRHELAHYITFIKYGPSMLAHNPLFRAFCKECGWGEEVYNATATIEISKEIEAIESNGILRKIQKLMSLSTSSNENESEQAMIKAQQLLLKHNIDSTYAEKTNEEKIVLKRILKQKKVNAKLRTIASILKTFFVNCVLNRDDSFIYLEIVGTIINVQIAEYVAEFLEVDLERLWEIAKWQHQLSGTIAKNSFFIGVATGYCAKIEDLQKQCQVTQNSLMIIEKQLVEASAMIYSKLTNKKSKMNYCDSSASLGEAAGRDLNIRPALNESSKESGRFLT